MECLYLVYYQYLEAQQEARLPDGGLISFLEAHPSKLEL